MEMAMHDRITLLLVVSVTISVFAGSYQYGYNISVVNAPAKIIQSCFFEGEPNACNVTKSLNNSSAKTSNISYSYNGTEPEVAPVDEDCEIVLTASELLVWSITVSIYTLGGMVGSFLVGTLVKRFGRKNAQMVMNSLSIVGAIMMACSKAADTIVLLIIPRFLLGVYSGLATGIVPLYIGEISPREYRGAVVALNQLLITIGLLTAQVLSLTEILGTDDLWPLLLALTCVPSIIQLFIFPWCPESPRCLLIDQNQEESARKVLIKLRGSHDVDEEIEEMKAEARAEASNQQRPLLDVLRDRTLRWQVFSVVALQLGQPLSGINAVFFYLNLILESAQVEEDLRNYISVGVGAFNVILTILTVMVIERTGRKPLLLGGYAILTFACTLMTIALSLLSTIPWMGTISIVSVFIFIIGFAIGPGPIAWIYTAEMFRQSARPAAFTLGCVINWTFNIVVALLFPFMQRFMGQYVFVVFMCNSAILTVYVWIIIPETKNKTFQEINLMFAKRNGIKAIELEKDETEMEVLS